jgi:arylsulfatase A-like enzyme
MTFVTLYLLPCIINNRNTASEERLLDIILIVIDTLRHDFVGSYGMQSVTTPSMDRLAARGWSFHRAFAGSFPTIPNRTDIMTGRYGGPFHAWKPLEFDLETLPAVLADYGYATQLIHDTPHLVNGGHAFDFPFHAWSFIRGAEVDRPLVTDRLEFLPHWKFDPVFDDYYPRDEQRILREHRALTTYTRANRRRANEEEWNCARLYTTASEFLEENRSRDNFFLWVDCFDPHGPDDCPTEYVKLYDDTPGYDGSIDPRAFCGEVFNNPKLSDAARKRLRALYAGKVTFMDRWLGTFLDTLERTGLDRNTAVILTSDHGTNYDDREDHPFGKTGTVSEHEAHVPLIVAGPGIPHGEGDALVQPQDLFATIASLAGSAFAGDRESYDLGALMSSGEIGRREIALTGANVSRWPQLGLENVLFSAFTREWRLGFTADPARSELMRIGTNENVARSNPDVVTALRGKALAEISRRGLDETLSRWLESGGRDEFPSDYRTSDIRPVPNAWDPYFKRLYLGR